MSRLLSNHLLTHRLRTNHLRMSRLVTSHLLTTGRIAVTRFVNMAKTLGTALTTAVRLTTRIVL